MGRNRRMNLVILNKQGLVHDFAGGQGCEEITRLAREHSQGRGRYVKVKAIQVQVFKLPGCRVCFGSEPAFKSFISTNM